MMKHRGFTLIEMIVVLSIVALLLTIALPRYFGAIDKSKDVVLQENLKILRVTLDNVLRGQRALPGTARRTGGGSILAHGSH